MILFLAILNSILFTPIYLVILIMQFMVYIPILYFSKSKTLSRYLYNNLIATDQACNALYGGDPDETISSRVGKDQNSNMLAKWIAKLLDLFQKNHATLSIEPEEGKNKVFKQI